MYSFEKMLSKVNKAIGRDGYISFVSAVLVGLLCHIPAMVMDAPNHDGLDSIYFDQNMITSGRWFLGTACGISSYFTLPWLIGLLALIYLGVTSVILNKLLKIKTPAFLVIISALLASFPVVASMFAYVFTMDGYMLGLLLSVLAVYLTQFGRFGFLFGAVSLAFSMGIYQAYLPIAIVLSIYMVLLILETGDKFRDKLFKALKYLYMGALGSLLYYVILQVMLKIQGKELASYQGISDMAETSRPGLLTTIKSAYADFVSFSLKGRIFYGNKIALFFFILFVISFVAVFIYKAISAGWLKSLWFYVIMIALALVLPLSINVIMFVSPNVTYHSLMRYQWVLLLVIPLAFMEKVCREELTGFKDICISVAAVSLAVMAFSYSITDNIGYSNLQKKYEKTYAYCLRLADRIEQTEGYYQGMPIYLIGIVGNENFPSTDLTIDVTDNMLGLGGDYLLYTSRNYEQFFKNYLGITFNILDEKERDIYFEDWYIEMPSFPETGSIRIVDGILCVKTENKTR